MRKINCIYFLLCFILIGIGACNKDQDSTLQNKTTEFNILLTDAPIDLEEVNIDIKEVLVIGNGMTDSLDISTAAGVYNLLDFQDGVTTLIGSSILSVDTITGVRIILGENNTVVKDGESFELKTPSAQQSGLKLKVCIPVTDIAEYDLTLDFDACKSVFQTGNGKFILKPRIKILNANAVCENDNDADGDEDSDDDDQDEDNQDEDDDDDDMNLDELPQTILDYLMMNYPDDLIEEVELVEWCNDTEFYIVEIETIEGDMLLFFDTD